MPIHTYEVMLLHENNLTICTFCLAFLEKVTRDYVEERAKLQLARGDLWSVQSAKGPFSDNT